MVIIEQIANKIIEEIKGFPKDAKSSQSSELKTVWDEYKEQVQYEEYDSFDVLNSTIESMIFYDVLQLSDEDFEELNHSINKSYYSEDLEERKEDIRNSILSYIRETAADEGIEYNEPGFKFIKYHKDNCCEDGPIIIAEVIKRVKPSEYLIHAYSKTTGPEGEQVIEDLTYLDQECGLDRITLEKFEEIKKNLYNEPTETLNESLQTQEVETNGNPQDDKEILASTLDVLRPKKISDIIIRVDEYIEYMREHRQGVEEFLDFIEHYISDYLSNPFLNEEELKISTIKIVDEMYIRVTKFTKWDICTDTYFGVLMNNFFYGLSMRNIFVLFVLDNQIRDDRFKLLVELFEACHFTTIYPYVAEKLEYGDGCPYLPIKEYKVIEKEIDDAVAQKKHICYVEKDDSANYIKNVLSLAEEYQNEYLCIFRNQAPDSYKKATWLMGSFGDILK